MKSKKSNNKALLCSARSIEQHIAGAFISGVEQVSVSQDVRAKMWIQFVTHTWYIGTWFLNKFLLL